MSLETGPVLNVRPGDTLSIDTSRSFRPGIPTVSQLEVLEVRKADEVSTAIVVKNLTPENLLPNTFLATVFRGSRGEDLPWFDALQMVHGIFPYNFEITSIT